jgi:uracil-DNA glycosylase family protein
VREVAIGPGFDDWQAAARELLRQGVPPSEVSFRDASVEAGRSAVTGVVDATTIRVPRRFVDLARAVAPHRDPSRWGLLYSVLWRLVHDNRELLESGDADVARLLAMERAVAEGREVIGAGPFVPPLPSAKLGDSVAALGALVAAAARCTGCDLYRHASRTVFGKGPSDARVVMVGEQPGDQEDRQGAPFVGPAGEVFDRALAEVGLPRERLYVSNVVKHFKFVPRGPRRIHQTPVAADIAACRPWVEAELTLIKPEILVCLGATASRALLGSSFRLMRDRGRFVDSPWAPRTIATFHPSAVLRGEDEAAQGRLYAMLRDDLRLVADSLSG